MQYLFRGLLLHVHVNRRILALSNLHNNKMRRESGVSCLEVGNLRAQSIADLSARMREIAWAGEVREDGGSIPFTFLLGDALPVD